MEQVARECKIGLAAYTMTHHTRQSAMGLPFIEKKVFDGKEYSVTSYTMSEIIASVNEIMENTFIFFLISALFLHKERKVVTNL